MVVGAGIAGLAAAAAVRRAAPDLDVVVLEASPTVVDVPYYYSDFTPIAAPAVEPIVTYDWRSPVFFDVP